MDGRDEDIWRERRLRSTPTNLQWRDTLRVEDYRKKQTKKGKAISDLTLEFTSYSFRKMGVGCLLNFLPYRSNNVCFRWFSWIRRRVARQCETIARQFPVADLIFSGPDFGP